MTNSNTTSTNGSVQNYGRATKSSDEAPMVITRLSGWIDMGEPQPAPPAWILRTRANTPAR